MIGLLFVSLVTAAVAAGDGEHVSTLSRHDFERAAMLNMAAYAPGIISFVLPKLGVVALLCRIFNPTRRWQIFLWAFVGGSGLVICGCIVILYAQCSPMRAMWTPGLGKCWSPSIVVDYSISNCGSTLGFSGYLPCILSRSDTVESPDANQEESPTPYRLRFRILVSAMEYILGYLY